MFTKMIILGAAAEVLHIGGLEISLWWWPFVFAFFKNIFILLDVLLLVGLVLVLRRFRIFGLRVYESVEEAVNSGKISTARMQRKWEVAADLMSSERLADRKKAVSEAEKLLDSVFRMANIPGENMEKRLEKLPEGKLNFQDDLLWAYKFKVSMESDPTFSPDDEEIKRAFYIFERSLKELGIL
jgi:hypothetical protein